MVQLPEHWRSSASVDAVTGLVLTCDGEMDRPDKPGDDGVLGRRRYPTIACGTNRLRFFVTRLRSSRMPMPAGSSPTIQAPTTG